MAAVVVGDLGTAMSHEHNAQRVQSLQNTEKNSSRGYCHAIYMLTRLRRQSQVFFFFQEFSCPVWQ